MANIPVMNLTELNTRDMRKVYMITYSQANLEKCPDRKTFAEFVLKAFDFENSTVKPLHWAVCKEAHQNGGSHYHMCIKLNKNKRWGGVKRKLLENGVNVNFMEGHSNYITAFRYVNKSDTEVLLSDSHPDLDLAISPKTSKASKARLSRKRNSDVLSTTKTKQHKPKRLSKIDVMEIIKSKNIKNETDLLSLASIQSEEGLNDLKVFIANNPERVYRELISKTWKLEQAQNKIKRSSESRISRIIRFSQGDCVEKCEGKWYDSAKQLLRNNNINVYVFAAALRDLLTNGRGKGRNIIIYGPANSGKTSILNPITTIFDAFTNPSSSKYAFVGAEKAEVIFMNDLRWSPDMISWQEFLNLLEGQNVHLAAPKSHFAEDIYICSDVPILATSISPIRFVGRSSNIEGENAMMDARWKMFHFAYQIPHSEQENVRVCPKCFSQLALLGNET